MRSSTAVSAFGGVLAAVTLAVAWPWSAARGRPSVASSMFPPVLLAEYADEHPLLSAAETTYLMGLPSGGTLAPEYVRIELGATLTHDVAAVETALGMDEIDVLVVDDGSFAALDKQILAEASQRHGVVFVGINVSMLDIGEEVLGLYRSHVVRRAIADGVWGERVDRGAKEFASIVWAPSEAHGSVSEMLTGFGRDGAWGVGWRDFRSLAGAVETTLWNRDVNGYALAGSGWHRPDSARAPSR